MSALPSKSPCSEEGTSAGEVASIGYSDGQTPGVSFGFDRRGRQTAVTQGGTAITRSFDDAGNLLGESYSGGMLGGVLVTNSCDALLRRTNLAVVQNSTTPLFHQSFSYDAASRLKTVTVGEHIITYTYLDDSPLVSQIAFQRGSATPMTTTRQYDKLNRLTNIVSAPSGAPAVKFSYGYNAASQRTERKEVDGSGWSFNYDSLGQVTSGKKYWADSSPVAGQQFGYSFDTIGNRLSTSSGGDNSGQNLRTANYTNNTLNQIVGRDVPGFVDVLGSANANANILSWVDTSSFAQPERKGSYFRAELPVNNSTGAVWMVISNFALLRGSPDRLTNSVMHAFVPMTPETFGYDADGNMTNDGRFSYTWDGENRLTKIESKSSAPTASKCRLQMTYDWQSRRTEKVVHTNNGAGYVGQYTNRFVYDGWNLVAELGPDGTLLRSHVWGLDASGTLQGAGGVGGLLATVIHTGIHAGTYFPSYDGNHNVAAYVSASSGEVVARYNHGPFGELIGTSGPMAREFNFLFSTKYYDWETGFYYYGYRYYDPSTGRWLSRDPIREKGGVNLYGFVRNNPANRLDRLGFATIGDIDAGRLIYSCNCGWIDLGHAGLMENQKNTGQARLWNSVNNGSGEEGGEFTVCYSQKAKVLGMPTGPDRCFKVKAGLTAKQKECVAIAILKNVSIAFEDLQATWPNTVWSDSGYSEEDLPSNMLGLLGAVRGYDRDKIFSLCGKLSKEESKAYWGDRKGLGKNWSFSPILAACGSCKGGRKLPKELEEPDCSGVQGWYREFGYGDWAEKMEPAFP
jgi:RHS repeat-associated protein